MRKESSIKLVELYPEMFTFTVRGYEHNVFEKAYNKALWWLHKHFRFTRSIDYIKQVNPYKYQFDVGEGWYGILYNLIEGIRNNDQKKGDWVTKVTQIKEKFGGLRFYVTGTSDKNWKLIRAAEEKSLATCEISGSEIEVGTWNDGWVKTMCRKEALAKFYNLIDEGKTGGKQFDEFWKPKEKAVVIETPKKKK